MAYGRDGQIQHGLKNPFREGTTDVLISPLDFLSKLAVLVPRPRYNLVRYHGVLARLPQLSHDLTLFLGFRIAKWLFLLMSRA